MRSTGSNLHAFSLQAGGRGMVGKLKNSNDILLVNQRISAQVFTVAGSKQLWYSTVIIVEVIVLAHKR